MDKYLNSSSSACAKIFHSYAQDKKGEKKWLED